MFRQKERREKHGLSKSVSYSAGSLYFRLALDGVDQRTENIDLKSYYEALTPLIDARNKIYLSYAIAVAALYFSKVGVLKGFSFGGISVDPIAIKHSLLVLTAALSLLFTMNFAKIARYDALFSKIFNLSPSWKKQDLILKYPKIFTPLHFGSWMTGSPVLMYPQKTYPIRVILLILASIIAAICMTVFMTWLVVGISVEIWQETNPRMGAWSKLTVAVCWSLYLTSFLVPTLSFRKLSFMHFGLGSMLERYRKNRPDRYKHYLNIVSEADLKRGGTLFTHKPEFWGHNTH
jgi:hypothetical protein